MKKIIITVALAIAVCALTVFAHRRNVQTKAESLGMYDAPFEVAERHVMVSSLGAPASDVGTPVHIMYRQDERYIWTLTGTGLLLKDFPNRILTAYHVFEERSGQYGYRRIGKNEFTGNEPIIPVVSLDSNVNADDSVVGVIGSVFTKITAPKADTFKQWKTKNYHAQMWSDKVKFTTYPGKEINGLFWVEVKPGTFHVFINCDVVEGESGTVATVKERNGILVIIQKMTIPLDTYRLLPKEVQDTMNWSPKRTYALANFIGITQKK